MTTPKAAIAEALQSFDHKDDKLWTDDGAPLVAEVQRLCNDKDITRAQINDALPGFARKTSDSVAEDEQPGDETGGLDAINAEAAANGVSPAAVVAAKIMGPPDPDEDRDDPLDAKDEYERLRLIAKGRVDDAEAGVTDAKNKIADAQRLLVAAEARLNRALTLYASKYPAISVAANIKQHLERQQEVLRERITGSRFEPNMAQNPVDATLMDRKRDNGRNGRGHTPAPAFLPRKAAVNY